MLKIYTELSLLDQGYPVEILIPFIGTFNREDDEGSVMYGRFDEFKEHGSRFLKLTNIEECDVCLFPIVYEGVLAVEKYDSMLLNFLEKVKRHGKKMLVFAGHDVPILHIPFHNAIVFNSAISKTTKLDNVYSWPHFFEDFLAKYQNGAFQPRKKLERATVGFCGYAPPLNLKWGKAKMIGVLKLAANYVGLIQKYPSKSSHSYRARAIIGLKLSNKIVLNLKLKSNFAFGPQGQLNTGKSSESHFDFRKNFVNTILDSDYTLCVRGIGNNSIRFFETLCCGRIPVFVNTDSVLPFEHIINWKNLCVWVEEDDIDKVAKKVEDFHNNISEEEFIDLQFKLRKIWVDYFSPQGFFSKMNLFLEDVTKDK